MAATRRLGGPGFQLVETVARTIATRSLLEGGEKLIVAVSGGPDSVCLLDVFARLQDKLDLELAIAHVDHGLSERSEKIAARVAHSAAEAGFEAHVVRAPDLTGPNLQARAREFRYAFFDIVMERENADAVATGHTLDDRVETTLARLIHGASTDGLASIPPAHRGRIRPLIDVRRPETRAYCDECDLTFYDDPANQELRFERVAVRAEVVDPIEKRWGDGAVRAMATSIDRLAEDADALTGISERLYAEMALDEDRVVKLPVDAFLGVPRALRRRLLEQAVGEVRDRSGGIEAALDAAEATDGYRRDARFAVASGIEIVLGSDHVIVVRPGE